MPGRAHERDPERDLDGAGQVDERVAGRDPFGEVLHEGFDPGEVGEAGDDHCRGESPPGVVAPAAGAPAEDPGDGGGGEEDGYELHGGFLWSCWIEERGDVGAPMVVTPDGDAAAHERLRRGERVELHVEGWFLSRWWATKVLKALWRPGGRR